MYKGWTGYQSEVEVLGPLAPLAERKVDHGFARTAAHLDQIGSDISELKKERDK